MPKFRDGMGISTLKERSRLAVAARLATKLAPLDDAAAIAQTAVDELHSAFGFFLAVVQRLDADDATLRAIYFEQPVIARERLQRLHDWSYAPFGRDGDGDAPAR